MTSVLIVEDQRMPRENMEHLVEDSGRYRRVASLSTAEMALAQCARHAVDLVLMDRTMAGESLYPDSTPETRLGQVSSTQLTPREIEVLRLVCEGLEYEEIAAELGISSRTVKRFVSSLLEKTGYSNRTRLAIAVTKKNFILPHLEE